MCAQYYVNEFNSKRIYLYYVKPCPVEKYSLASTPIDSYEHIKKTANILIFSLGVSQTVVRGPTGVLEYILGDPRIHVQKVKKIY